MNERICVPGESLHDQAVHLAGVLAEHGATRLRVRGKAGNETELAARQTDLPGVIASGEVAELICDELGVNLRIGRVIDGVCSRRDVAASLGGVVGKNPSR